MNPDKLTAIRTILILFTSALCITIFALSADTADESNAKSDPVSQIFETSLFENFGSDNSFINYIMENAVVIVRKAAHFFEYALLGSLLAATCLSFHKSNGFTFIISVICGTLYAVSDEIHQYFVPGRSCQISDMLLDSSGVLFGTAIVILSVNVYFHIRKKKNSVQ